MDLKVKFLAVCMSVALLTACDSESIKQVKESVNYSIDSTLTTGKAFETRSDCINGTWDEAKDNRDRTIVSYHCEFTPQAISIINDELQKRLTGTFNYVKNDRLYMLKNYNDSLKNTQDSIALYDRFSQIFASAQAQLLEAYKKDEFAVNNLYFNDYVTSLLGLSYMGGYRETLETVCNGDNYSRYSRDIDEAYVAESCKKNMYPVFASYKKAIDALDRSNHYDFFMNLYNTANDNKNSDSDVGELVQARISEYKQQSITHQQDIPPRISEVESQLAENNTLLENAKPDFAVKKVTLTQNWIVSDTGGVDIINGALTAETNDREMETTVSGNTLMPFAYADYTKDQMPSWYLVKIKALFDEQLEGFRRQLKQ